MDNIEYIKLNNCRFYSEAEGEIVNSLAAKFKTNEQYLELKKKQQNLYESLNDAFQDNLHEMLIDYSDVLNEILMLQQSNFYRAGFVDGARLIQGIMGTKEVNCVFKLGDI
ncbi:MAG: hypothetical protein A2Y21_04870 [Clostridiales bacterium GWC2_40_7]|nr:MAG: hypothetical protein A2Y21_04870 [Clostridiales bacterium GWC2_40_7]